MAKKRKFAAARGMSRLRASASGLPVSSHSMRASSSSRASMPAAIASRMRERSAAGVLPHTANARDAASAARATSAASPRAIARSGSPVAGSSRAMRRPDCAGSYPPLMK